MCGIYGIVDSNVVNKKEILHRMSDVLQHRGPDGSGIHFFNNCALGHNRLKIVDPINGDQPMLSADGNVGLTFNGEIYGYKAIKTKINYPFDTTSDTEVLLALYQEYGIAILEKLPGMFSFGIWDAEKKMLFCARDRFGEKPFYYAFGDKGEFIFASEIKAIIRSKLLTPEIDIQSLSHYLQKLYVHPTKTIYSNIYTLPPAHKLILNRGKLAISCYWNYPQINDTITIKDAVEKFRELLNNAIANQLVADVPVGAFLSGGLDSSTIVALASKYSNNLKTFSFNFDGNYNEQPYSSAVADRYSTVHTELEEENIRLDEMLIQMQKVYDEPFADSSNIPTFIISKLASEHLKVILTGDGGDEMLAGYSYWYNDLLYMKKQIDRKQYERGLLSLILKMINRYQFSLPDKWNRHMRGIEHYIMYRRLDKLHAIQKQYYNSDELIGLGLDPGDNYHQENNIGDNLDNLLKNDIKNYLPGDILVKTDRASMANGLELRTPFLDLDFASFCISLPYNLKINTKNDKIILREAFENLWPINIRSRAKMGFGSPVKKWLKRQEMIKMKEDYLLDANNKIYSYLDFQNARQYFKGDHYQTWILLVLSVWFENRVT